LPLDILGLPGYESLSQPEKELCSSIRQAQDQSMSIFTNIYFLLYNIFKTYVTICYLILEYRQFWDA
jgi:hypothetical protein